MDIVKEIFNNKSIIISRDNSIEAKSEAFKSILQYVMGMKKLSEYCVMLAGEIEQLISGNDSSSYILEKLCDELIMLLGLNEWASSSTNRIIFMDNTPVSVKVMEYLSINNIPYLRPEIISMPYINQYNALFFVSQGGDNQECLKCISAENIVNLDLILDIDINKAPYVRSVFEQFNKSIMKENGYEVLVTGLSYGRDSIHCDLLNKKTVTLANSGQDLYYDLQCLKYAKKELPELKNVISVLAPYTLRYDESLAKRQSASVLVNYSIFRDRHNNTELNDILLFYDNMRKKVENVLNWDDFLHWYYEYKYSNRIWYDNKEIFHSDIINEIDDIEVRKRYNKPYEETLIENKKIMLDYCEKVKEYGMRLLFFIPPFSSYYRNLWNEDYYIELMDYITELDEKYDIDCIDMSHSDIPDYCFRDSGHLNRIGAIYVSEIINKWLEE